MLTHFHSSFTDRFTSKFATKSSLTIPPHLNYVTTLLCEISEKLLCSRSKSIKQAVMQNAAIQNSCWKILYSDFRVAIL